MTLTVLTWLWKQPESRTVFTADHVNIWAAMVRRYCNIDIDLACVTDMPKGIDKSIRIIKPPNEFEDIYLPRWTNGRPQCLRRISMFRPDAADIFGERFVCMDLDCVIANSLDGLFSSKEDFRICKGTAKDRPYNGSLLLMTAGCRPKVYTNLNQENAIDASARFLGSDQAWIAHALGGLEAKFTPDDGIIWSTGWFKPDSKIMFFPGSKKPWDFVREGKNNWILENYYDNEKGRGIYLGNDVSVWDDASSAMDEPYCGIIATPETAKYLPNRINAIAYCDEAERLGRMLGYNLVFCGVGERKVG